MFTNETIEKRVERGVEREREREREQMSEKAFVLRALALPFWLSAVTLNTYRQMNIIISWCLIMRKSLYAC